MAHSTSGAGLTYTSSAAVHVGGHVQLQFTWIGTEHMVTVAHSHVILAVHALPQGTQQWQRLHLNEHVAWASTAAAQA